MDASASPAVTIDPREAAHFGAMAADWWDPRGSSAMLHRLNPVRLRYLRGAIDRHWGTNPAGRRPLGDRTALDVGCGGGLMAEPLARMGARVTGMDAAPEAIAVAAAHAAGQGLPIDYLAGELDQLGERRFDLVTAMEVVEHVADQPAFVARLARLVAPGGLLVMSTPNRTAFSRFALIWVGEGLRQIPRGTHDWDRFLTPDELGRLIAAAGMRTTDLTGLGFRPDRGFALGPDTAMDYLVSAVHA